MGVGTYFGDTMEIDILELSTIIILVVYFGFTLLFIKCYLLIKRSEEILEQLALKAATECAVIKICGNSIKTEEKNSEEIE